MNPYLLGIGAVYGLIGVALVPHGPQIQQIGVAVTSIILIFILVFGTAVQFYKLFLFGVSIVASLSLYFAFSMFPRFFTLHIYKFIFFIFLS